MNIVLNPIKSLLGIRYSQRNIDDFINRLYNKRYNEAYTNFLFDINRDKLKFDIEDDEGACLLNRVMGVNNRYIFDKLIKDVEDFNKHESLGYTYLISAMTCENPYFYTKFFIDNGARVNETIYEGLTALSMSVFSNVETAQLLLDYDAELGVDCLLNYNCNVNKVKIDVLKMLESNFESIDEFIQMNDDVFKNKHLWEEGRENEYVEFLSRYF